VYMGSVLIALGLPVYLAMRRGARTTAASAP